VQTSRPRVASETGSSELNYPALFAIGDIQGCFDEFQRLLDVISSRCKGEFEIWLAGDLVNRGPRSLDVLRWCVANQRIVKVVLGNHDLHLLAVVAGIRSARIDDTLSSILMAPDRDALISWLRKQPLALYARGFFMVHAGLLPQWSITHALELSREVSGVLASNDWQQFLSSMYGNEPLSWSPALRGPARARFIINAMTRLRFCKDDGEMEFESKEGIESAPSGYKPWFDTAHRVACETPIVFGHWSSVGLVNRPNLIGIDTGCVWGGSLTAVRLSSKVGEREIIQVRHA
jgi:bis(5'-nucleosyl)-tetraphosphatase (symmetrical)